MVALKLLAASSPVSCSGRVITPVQENCPLALLPLRSKLGHGLEGRLMSKSGADDMRDVFNPKPFPRKPEQIVGKDRLRDAPMRDWTITVKIKAYDFNSLKSAFARAAADVSAARTPSDLSMNWGNSTGSTPGHNEVTCNSEYSCPDEDRIKMLRAEADSLEAKLRSHG